MSDTIITQSERTSTMTTLTHQRENCTLSLDLFSITQTSEHTSGELCSDFCINNAPYFALKREGKLWQIWQGCCNSWNCPKCGERRAKAEYGRIIEGVRQIALNRQICFITLTSRGQGLSLSEAESIYLPATNRILTAMRTRARRDGQDWYYVQVTERQKRGHPHSHILTTWTPHDLREGHVTKWRTNQSGLKVSVQEPALRSDWLQERCISAGLGEQYDISIVREPEAVSRYVAKYLFKPSMLSDVWPKNWQRIRYSNSWPKLPEMQSEAVPLVSEDDWRELAKKALVLHVHDQASEDKAKHMLAGRSDVLLRRLQSET